jgi:phage recombination protein Bet
MAVTAKPKAPERLEPAQSRGDVAVLQTRLPLPAEAIALGFNAGQWKVLVEAVYPAAKTADAVLMALHYCKARNLDPMKRPVHIVPMYDSKQGRYVETVWPGISELRTTAVRTGQYAGCEETQFGPMIELTFTGTRTKWVRGQAEDFEDTVTLMVPEWAQMTVYRQLNGHLCKFVGPKVYWLESYASLGKSDLPNDMWEARPIGQLEKCAEAGALRKAFPEEFGNDYTAEEMAGRKLVEGEDAATKARDVTPIPSDPPAPPVDDGAQQRAEPTRAAAQQQAAPAATESFDMGPIVRKLDGAFKACTTIPELKRAWTDNQATIKPLKGEALKQVEELRDKHKKRITDATSEALVQSDGFDLNAFIERINAAFAKCGDRGELQAVYDHEVTPLFEKGTLTEEHISGPVQTVYDQHRDRIDELPADDGGDPPAPDDDGFPGDR